MTTSTTGPATRHGRPYTLITGASSGLGEAFAERLAADGHDLIVVARREDRLRALADRLGDAHATATEVLVADLTAPEDLRRVEARIASGPALDLLVNNAGFGGYRPFLRLDPDRAEELIRLQVLAVTRLARAALPAMVARGRGAVINVSSQLAFSAALPSPPLPPGRAVYAATKAYVNAFTQLLAGELAGTGVGVQALCPGVMRTEFYARMGTDVNRLPIRPMEPAEVVRASLAGLQRGDVLCVPGLDDASALDGMRAAEGRLFEQAWRTGSPNAPSGSHTPGGKGQ
jgi:short-subunit dehydrogenase